MQRLHLLTPLLLASLAGTAQQPADTILPNKELTAVRVDNLPGKIKVHKITGFPSYASFEEGETHVCLVKGYPRGKLVYLEFYFNTGLPNMLKKKLKIHYRDVQLQLLLFKVDTGSRMGASLLDRDLRFVVKATDDGAYRVPVDSLGIVEDSLFVGLRVIGPTVKGEANLYVRMNETKNGVAYRQQTQPPFAGRWFRYTHADEFKLRVGVQVRQPISEPN
ncbi:MAG: hypothetical protein EOO08_03150 [Chitinophagaceae bacterium]|nr:MAG: hypothetical protein EOO08_03150 [Chitinophagaceae bacterium]